MCAQICPCGVDFEEPETESGVLGVQPEDVANVHVEVEAVVPGGYRTDRYHECMGYAVFFGELVIYNHDGADIARYQSSEYDMITSWEVLADGTVV